MKFNVIPVDRFKKEATRLIKKYPSLKNELVRLNDELTENPNTGMPLGNGAFKIRISIKSKGKGKRGGARVITYVLVENHEVYLLTIFDKSEYDTIDDRILKQIIRTISAS
jgi:mRNA-degrading endonuclease RelE of RelBE toxin-antitoxin system